MKIKFNFQLANLILLFYSIHACFGLYSNVSHVVELTPRNFDNSVVKGDEVWIVQFYAPWCSFCQNFVAEFTKLSNVLRGIIKVGVVDADVHRELAGLYNVRSLPSIKIFGVDKQKPEDYTDGKNAREIMRAALNAAAAKIASRFDVKEQQKLTKDNKDIDDYVIQLTDSNFDDLVILSPHIWMVEFYAPWCGYCRSLEPHWKKAAKKLHGKVKFGAIDGTINRVKLAKYNIKGYPSMKLFLPNSTPIDYEGERISEDIVSWTMEKYEDTLPIPELTEIVNEQTIFEQCDGKQWALVSFLPDLFDCKSICRQSYLATLNKLAKRFKKNNWCWLWSEANAQPEIQRILHVGGSGYPVLIAVNYKTRSYSTFIGAFVEEQIYKFLINLYAGLINKVQIEYEYMPEIISVEPWDGKDVLVAEPDDKDEL